MDTNKNANQGRELLLADEVYAVVGSAMAVHSELGAGFLEAVYHEALQIELEARGITHASQVELQIRYKNKVLKKHYCADFICFGQLLVEIKAEKELTTKDEAQILNYLKATGLRVGLLVNFGDPARLEWKRLIR